MSAGDELARQVGIRPGPVLGALLAELTEADWAGELGDRERLLAHARDWLAHESGGAPRALPRTR